MERGRFSHRAGLYRSLNDLQRGSRAKGGGGGGTSTSSVMSVPTWAQGYVSQYAQTAYNLWQAPTLAGYGGTIVAAQNFDELAGISALAIRGEFGEQVVTDATDMLIDVLSGTHLLGDDADFTTLDGTIFAAVANSNNSIMSLVGKTPYFVDDPDGGATLLAQKILDDMDVFGIVGQRMMNLIYADNYAKERQLQDHGLSYGVEMAKHDAINAEIWRKSGFYVREYLQGTYDLNHKRFIEDQEMAVANLEIFGNVLRALTGSQQSTTTQMEGGSKFMATATGVVGGAIAGAMVGSIIPGVGTAIGAVVGGVIGGIAGYFS